MTGSKSTSAGYLAILAIRMERLEAENKALHATFDALAEGRAYLERAGTGAGMSVKAWRERK